MAPAALVEEVVELERRSIDLCVDQAEWLEERLRPRGAGDADGSCVTQGEAARSSVLQRLISLANREPAMVKRQIFLVVRCHRCLQHTRGGEKSAYEISLPKEQWQWLEAVQERSKHATVGKTLRIIIDFYRPICDRDADFEESIFGFLRQSPLASDVSTLEGQSADSTTGSETGDAGPGSPSGSSASSTNGASSPRPAAVP